MKLTQISLHLNEFGIPTIPPVFSDSQSLIASIKNRIYRRTAVEHIATRYYLAADMARDGEIHLSYVPLLRSSPTASQSHCRSPPS